MLTLQETKLHLRVDHDDEDVLIGALIDTATAAVGERLNMPPEQLTPTTQVSIEKKQGFMPPEQLTPTVPSPIKSAALLLIGSLYADRESQSDRPFNSNPTFEMLLAPYRVYT